MTSLNPLAQEQIARLHRGCVGKRSEILRILRDAAARGTRLQAGVSRTAAIRECAIREVDDRLSLLCRDFSPVEGRHYYFTLALESDEFFFVSRLRSSVRSRLEFDVPQALYRAERRESHRDLPSNSGVQPLASLLVEGRPAALVKDVSRDGLGIRLAESVAKILPSGFELEVSAASGVRSRLYAEVRNQRRDGPSTAWLGLSVSSVPNSARMELEQDHSVLRGPASWKRFSLASKVAAVGVDRVWRKFGPNRHAESPSVIRFRNQLDQELVGIVNSNLPTAGAPVVLIPPAWGKTKETLLPLALTIVETCREAALPISVLRFDGTNRRGESHVDGRGSLSGDEYRRFRFSQAVQDLMSAMRFVREDERFRSTRCVIISFSLSAIEARRAVAEAPPEWVAGWIPVVGMVDLQSGLRAVSGGVDYAEGILKGVEFGLHELVGVLADMDFTGRDAIDSHLVFKEDARRDMARIHAPVTWIHGEHDAWIDVNRVRDVLSAGFAFNRRLVQVPTGHQLRTSREALRTFELIASETVRMVWGRKVAGSSPALKRIDRIRDAEARRVRNRLRVDLREFWRDYLLGRDGLVGMDLLTSTSTYRDLMKRQIAGLTIDRSSRVLDLGSGTGAFERELESIEGQPKTVISLDIVLDALMRGSRRVDAQVRSAFVQADLDSAPVLPFADDSMDAVLASLVLSYLREPSNIVREIKRVLRPGGRAAISSLRRDADISAIYLDGVSELVAKGAEGLALEEGVAFAELQRSFLNEAAKLLDLEEQGLFRFYDEDELASLVRDSGLRVVSVERALGSPPQAILLVAERAE